MKLYVLVSFCIAACVAKPDGSHLMDGLSNAYLPSRSGSVGDDNYVNFEHGSKESQIVQITSKPNVVVTTIEPTRATNTPQSFETNRQFTATTSGISVGGTSQPAATTHAPISTSPSAIKLDTSTSTAVTNIVTSTQPTIGSTIQPFITTQIPQVEYETNPPLPALTNVVISGPSIKPPISTPSTIQITTNTPQPSTTLQPTFSHLPIETHLTETRFNPPQPPIQMIPIGSYLPTSNFINSVFQVPQSNFGDNSFLTVPGFDSVQHVGAGQKSVYFYAAPDDDDIHSRLRINILPSSQKNTRIIFIKAPSFAAPIPEVISPPSEASDKTLIYVLSKKPDPASAISIPTSTIVKPTKPEIYFIKYGSQQEAQQAVASGIYGNAVGENIQDLLNEQSFINTIKDASSGIGTSSGIKGSITTGGGTGSVTTVVSKGTDMGSGTVVVSSGGSKFGPAGESGPY